MSRRRRLLFALLLTAGVMGFLEAAASVYYFSAVDEGHRQVLEAAIGVEPTAADTAIRYRPHPYFNYVCNPGYAFPSGLRPHNAEGFRLPEWPRSKPAGSIRVVALGGSTTYGMHSERGDEVWPALVEQELRARGGGPVTVLNLGVPNYTAHEAIGVAAMLVPTLEPDFVLLHFGGNEAFTAVYPDEGGPDNTTFRHSWTYRPLPEPARLAMRRSYLARLVGYLWMARGGLLPGGLVSTMQYPFPAPEDAVANAGHATGRWFRQAMTALVALVRAAGAEPVLVDQPLNPAWDHPKSPIFAAIVAAHLRNNRILRELGESQRVPVVQLYPAMRDHRLFNDALHESPAGMRLMARLVADALRPLVAARAAATARDSAPARK